MSDNQKPGIRYAVVWPASPFYIPEITSSLVAGLAMLAAAAEISLRLEANPALKHCPHILRLQITDNQSGATRSIAIDEFDRMDRFSEDALREVDVYFKRSFNPEALLALPQGVRSRVQPLGTTFATYSTGSRYLMAKASISGFHTRFATERFSGIPEGLAQLLHNASEIASFLHLQKFERQASDPVSDRIVYQTRLWPPMPSSTIDRTAVNTERLHLVRALRAAFGGQDTIGIIPTALAERTAADCLLSRDVKKRKYLWQLRTSLVAVNSHGLDGSAGLKVGEALAAGCALVSQPLQVGLPEPLLPEIHYLPFETPDECVAQCRRLLSDKVLAGNMRSANADYYIRNVRPDAHARQVLARAIADT